jgi:hypothetical protein
LGGKYLNGREPKSSFGRVFNPKLAYIGRLCDERMEYMYGLKGKDDLTQWVELDLIFY